MFSVMAIGLMTTLGTFANNPANENVKDETSSKALEAVDETVTDESSDETIEAVDSMTITLKEFTVKGTAPKTRVKGDAMRTIVNGSVLGQTTSATEMLKYVPNVKSESGDVSVFGRGAAEVYINGRKVQDLKELDQIRPELIQYVDVVANPGARYAASTRAVIRITMKKAQGEGFGFINSAYASYQYDWTAQEQFEANYRKGGLDITGSITGTRFAVGQDQVLTIRSKAGNDILKQVGNDHTRGTAYLYQPKLQFNYIINKNHSFGAWYQFRHNPYQKVTAHLNTRITLGNDPQERTYSEIFNDWNIKNHAMSMYYNGQVGLWNIDFNADAVFSRNDMPITTTEEVFDKNDTKMGDVKVDNHNNDNIDLYATKLIFTRPLLGGSLSFGGEYSYSKHGYDFRTQQIGVNLPASDTNSEVNENIAAGFVEYTHAFGKLQANAGVRFEHAQNDYYEEGQLVDDQSRTYNDFFPSVTLGMPVGKVQMQLSYAQDITRPDYNSLNNNLMYVNKYTMQCGNPKLRPTYAHNIVYNASYKWATLMATFSHTKDAMSVVARPYYPNDPSNPVVLMGSENIEAYNSGNISLTLAPVIKQIWRPQFVIQGSFQNYRTQDLQGNFFHLNRPMLSLTWQNFITLPKGFLFMPTLAFNSKGDEGNMRINENIYSMSFSLRKSFLKNKLDVTLNASNPFEWADNNITLYGARKMSTDKQNPRSFYANVVYKFNESRSKYKGSGAGDAQKKRMKN